MARLRVWLAYFIAAIYAGSFIDAVLMPSGVTLFGFVTPVMLVIVTALFALSRNGNGRRNGNGA